MQWACLKMPHLCLPGALACGEGQNHLNSVIEAKPIKRCELKASGDDKLGRLMVHTFIRVPEI
jgi:hypothetical protein